jgi:hypothetical protein
MKKSGEKNLDLLQNIEFAIVDVYREDAWLIDVDVQDAMDALARHYHALEEQRTPPVKRLGDRAERVFLSVQNICDWRVGRAPLSGETDVTASVIPVSELVSALRTIQKSIPRWSRQGGRRGYLDFVIQYLP